MFNAMYKTKQLNNGLWHVLVSFGNANGERVWIKLSTRGYKTEDEAENALCKQLDADAAANEDLLNSDMGNRLFANVN